MSPIPLGILAVAGSAPAGAYELISTQVLSSSASSVTFSSIPQDFKHLQIRMVTASQTSTQEVQLRFNSDSGSNYNQHSLGGNGSSVFSSYGTNTSIEVGGSGGPGITGWFNSSAIDILDYTNSSKNTTVRTLCASSISTILLLSGLWRNTNAISSINLFGASSYNFIAGSRFSLYGIKG